MSLAVASSYLSNCISVHTLARYSNTMILRPNSSCCRWSGAWLIFLLGIGVTHATTAPSLAPSPKSAAPSLAVSDLPTLMQSDSPSSSPSAALSYSPSKPPTCNLYDAFGTEMIYRSDPFKVDWDSGSWNDGKERTLSQSSLKTDPSDDKLTLRGSGNVTLDGNGTAILYKSPSLFIESADSATAGWQNVEFTGYAKIYDDPAPKGYTGINILLRTDHGPVVNGDGCDAPLYWASINYETGLISFIKEYFHDETAVVRSRKVIFNADAFSDGIPSGLFIGVKFILYNTGSSNVRLELLIDMSDGRNEWNQVASHKDRPGEWNATKPFPTTCAYGDGDTFRAPARYCGLFNVGSDSSTKIEWKDVSVRNIVPEKLKDICEWPSSSPSGVPSLTPSSAPTSRPSVSPSATFSAAPSRIHSAGPSSSFSDSPSAPPSLTHSASPSIEPSYVPSSRPSLLLSTSPSITPSNSPSSRPSVLHSTPPSVTASTNPSFLPSTSPTIVISQTPSSEQPVSFSATSLVVFPGVEEELESDAIEIFEQTTGNFINDNLGDESQSLVILSVELSEQILLSVTPRRGLRRTQEKTPVSEPKQLAIEFLVIGEGSRDEHSSISFASTVNAIVGEGDSLRSDLSTALPAVFAIRQPPLDDRTASDGNDQVDDDNASDGKNVGAIVSGVLIPMLFVGAVVAAVLLRRRNVACGANELSIEQDGEVISSNSSSIAEATLHPYDTDTEKEAGLPKPEPLSSSPDSGDPYYDKVQFGQQGLSPELLSGPASLSVSPESGNDDAGGQGSIFSGTSDLSDIFGSTTGASAGGSTRGDLEEEEIMSPSALSHNLYPIASAESDETGSLVGMNVSSNDEDDDKLAEKRINEQRMAFETLVENQNDDYCDSDEDDEDDEGDDSIGDLQTAKPSSKGSPMRAVFNCFSPSSDVPVQSSIMSVYSASSRSSKPLSVNSLTGSPRIYTVRAPPGPLGMVVVSSRKGPRVYHLKTESPLFGVLEEGDVIVGIDEIDTSTMTATTLRRFLRTRDSASQRTIKVLGRRRETGDSSSGEYSL